MAVNAVSCFFKISSKMIVLASRFSGGKPFPCDKRCEDK